MKQTPDIKPIATALLVAPAAILMFGVFVLPFLFLVVLSFWSQVPGSLGMDPTFTLANYARIISDSYYLGGLWTTLWLSGLVTLICLILALPLVVWAIALLSIYAQLGINGTLPGLILAHVTITMPFAARIMIATFDEIDPNLEAAAKSLGASPWQVVRRITLPLARPGLLSSTAIAFLVSFNDVVVTTLIAGAGWITFPVRTFSRLRTEGIDPTTIAIGAMIVAFTILVIVLGQRLFQLSRRF